jgi:hypothetical protein
MKEKDNCTSLTDRQSGSEEKNNLRRILLYSAGEDFYSIYHEKEDSDSENLSESSAIN